MKSEIDVRMGEMAVGSGKTVLRTGGIGSCVVIVIYDDIKKVGGMAHAMLPTNKKAHKEEVIKFSEQDPSMIAKYVDDAVERLVTEVEKLGGNRVTMEARLIGGAHMFKSVADSGGGIGQRNIEEAHSALENFQVRIRSEETGGSVGRLAELNLENGLVNVVTKM